MQLVDLKIKLRIETPTKWLDSRTYYENQIHNLLVYKYPTFMINIGRKFTDLKYIMRRDEFLKDDNFVKDVFVIVKRFE